MEDSGGELFAGAGFSGEEDVTKVGADAAELRAEELHWRAFAEHLRNFGVDRLWPRCPE
jgi:hypothetical protein